MRLGTVLRPGLWLAPAVLAATLSPAHAHDEDWRKLADRIEPFVGPIVTAGDDRALRSMFPSSNVELLAWIPVNNFPGANADANDCWGYVSPSGREYAIIGLRCGFGFAEVTDPTNPVVLTPTYLPGASSPCSFWSDVKVIGEYAYGVSEGGGGIQVIDLRQIDSGIVRIVKNVTIGGHTTTHNIAANPETNTIYCVGANVGNGGLIAYDVSDPENPVLRGAWTTRYVHDAQIVSYDSGPFAGRDIAYCFNGPAGVEVIDVTNPAAMVRIGGTSYPTIGYCHQGWLSEDRQFLFANDELDEQTFGLSETRSRVFDVSNPAAPVFVGTYSSGITSIDHNTYVAGDFVFQANYRSGLRVFDASTPASPVEVAFFDTHPEGDGNNFNGAWSLYPYLPSKTVIVSDIERGMFLLRVTPFEQGLLDLTYGPGLISGPAQPGESRAVNVSIEARLGATLDPASVELRYTVDGGTEQSVPMSPLGASEFTAVIPGQDCFAQIGFRVVARTVAGGEFATEPGEYTVLTDLQELFADTAQTNPGWTTSAVSLTDGGWDRGVPAGGGTRGDPAADFDGSGACWLTDNVAGNSDLDGGPAFLTSPIIDLSDAPNATLRFAYWIYSNGSDPLDVQLSSNGGSSWQTVRTYLGTESSVWRTDEIRIADFITPTSTFRLRFAVTDNPNNSVTEAGIDAVFIESPICEAIDPACSPADVTTTGSSNGTPDGAVDVSDYSFYLTLWAAGDARADLTTTGSSNGTPDGAVDVSDFSFYLTLWAAGCP